MKHLNKGVINMKYQSIFDIWAVPVDLLKHVQAGQMVYAGDKSNRGRFLGVRKSGSIVVAWQGNVQNHSDKLGYIKSLRNYAKGN
jgi:hypothetical protein